MNSWLHGLEIVSRTLSVGLVMFAFGILFVALWKRKRVEERMRTRPYRNLSATHRWTLITVGLLLLLGFEFFVTPHFGIHVPFRRQVVIGLGGAVVYIMGAAVCFSATRRIHSLPVAARLRTMYILLALACVFGLLSLHYAF